MFSSEVFNIVVTNQRFIFALLTSQMVKEAAASHQGQGFSGFIKSMGSGYTVWQRYQQMPPEQALRENTENFAVYLNQIRRIKFSGDKILYQKGAMTVGLKMGFGGGGDDDDSSAKLEIDTVNGKYNFEIPTQFQQQTAQTLKNAGLIK